MTVPTTSSTPTMMTARTVPVSWFAIPRLCLNSIFLVSPQVRKRRLVALFVFVSAPVMVTCCLFKIMC